MAVVHVRLSCEFRLRAIDLGDAAPPWWQVNVCRLAVALLAVPVDVVIIIGGNVLHRIMLVRLTRFRAWLLHPGLLRFKSKPTFFFKLPLSFLPVAFI